VISMIHFGNSPLTYIEIKELTTFFRNRGCLEKAINISNKEGFVAVMEYKQRLEHTEVEIKQYRPDLSVKTDKNDIVAFCMRCFGNSAVEVDENTNFCHNCGSGGTCIAIKKDEAEYLRGNIESAIKNASIKGGIIK